MNKFALRSKIYLCFQTCASSHCLHSSKCLPVVNQSHSMFGLTSFTAFQSRECSNDWYVHSIQSDYSNPLYLPPFRSVPLWEFPSPLLTWMCIQQLWKCCLSVLQGTSRLHLLRIVFVQQGLWGRGPAGRATFPRISHIFPNNIYSFCSPFNPHPCAGALPSGSLSISILSAISAFQCIHKLFISSSPRFMRFRRSSPFLLEYSPVVFFY